MHQKETVIRAEELSPEALFKLNDINLAQLLNRVEAQIDSDTDNTMLTHGLATIEAEATHRGFTIATLKKDLERNEFLNEEQKAILKEIPRSIEQGQSEHAKSTLIPKLLDILKRELPGYAGQLQADDWHGPILSYAEIKTVIKQTAAIGLALEQIDQLDKLERAFQADLSLVRESMLRITQVLDSRQERSLRALSYVVQETETLTELESMCPMVDKLIRHAKGNAALIPYVGILTGMIISKKIDLGMDARTSPVIQRCLTRLGDTLS